MRSFYKFIIALMTLTTLQYIVNAGTKEELEEEIRISKTMELMKAKIEIENLRKQEQADKERMARDARKQTKALAAMAVATNNLALATLQNNNQTQNYVPRLVLCCNENHCHDQTCYRDY